MNEEELPLKLGWNPRYVAYAGYFGRTPEAQQKFDREVNWPASPATGFILWISERKQEFKKQNPKAFLGDDISDFDAWDEFLKELGGLK